LNQKLTRRRIDGIDPNASSFRQPDAEAIRRYVEAQRQRKPNAATAR
jgi:hypothetical protein